MTSLHVEVRDDEIIVTQSGSKFRAIYHSVHHKPGEQPQLIVSFKEILSEADARGYVVGNVAASVKIGNKGRH